MSDQPPVVEETPVVVEESPVVVEEAPVVVEEAPVVVEETPVVVEETPVVVEEAPVVVEETPVVVDQPPILDPLTSLHMNPTPSVPEPEVLTFADILSDHSLAVAKENADKSLLETIGAQSIGALRPKLVEWVQKGCPPGYPILSLEIRPPPRCSDGETRSLADYIQFCSGKSIAEHVGLLQVKLPDILISFANMNGNTTITVIKA